MTIAFVSRGASEDLPQSCHEGTSSPGMKLDGFLRTYVYFRKRSQRTPRIMNLESHFVTERSTSVNTSLASKSLRSRCLPRFCVLCALCGSYLCHEVCSAADIRIWEFEATVVHLNDPGFASADVRLGDPVRGTFSYDVATAPDLNTAADYESYTPQPGYRGVQLVIVNPRTESRIEFVPLVSQGFEYWIDVWTYDDTTPPDDSDESGINFYQFTAPAHPNWPYSDYFFINFLRPGVSTDFSLPTEYDLANWPFAAIYLSAEKLLNSLIAEIHTITPVAPGDFDLDGDVDSADYGAWRGEYGTSGYSDADGNRDSRIDAADYVIWRDNLGASTAASAAIPEPASAALCLLVLLCFELSESVIARRRGTKCRAALAHCERLSLSCLVALLALMIAPRQANADLTEGLISYWPFDGNGTDVSPFDRDLTLQGGVGYATGLFGQALDMHNNPSTYAQRLIDDEAYDFGGTDFTVQVWVNYYSTIFEQVLVEKFTGGEGPGWTLTKIDADDFQFYSDEGFNSPNQTISPNVWHQVLVRRTESQLQVWRDGETVVNASLGIISNTTTPLYVGRRNPADPRIFSMDGRLDEVAIWNRALADSEIAHLYNGGFGNPVVPPPGDFSGNGAVDAADYVVWRDGLHTRYTQGDYDLWKSNFRGTPLRGAQGTSVTSVGLSSSNELQTFVVGGTTYNRDDLVQPTLVEYAGWPERTSILVSTGEAVPSPGDRSELLTTDFLVDTGIINPNVGPTAATLTFSPPLVNGPGPDLVVLEITADASEPPDAFQVKVNSTTGSLSAWGPQLATIGFDTYSRNGRSPVSISELENGAFRKVDNFAESPLFGIAIDLDEFGVTPQAQVSTIQFGSAGIQSFDPVLFMGIRPAATLSGDFNGDATVDAADYVIWRNGLGTKYTQADDDVWRATFDQMARSGTFPSGVPEPSSCALALVWYMSLGVSMQRRAR